MVANEPQSTDIETTCRRIVQCAGTMYLRPSRDSQRRAGVLTLLQRANRIHDAREPQTHHEQP